MYISIWQINVGDVTSVLHADIGYTHFRHYIAEVYNCGVDPQLYPEV